jgi:hypothetical protein
MSAVGWSTEFVLFAALVALSLLPAGRHFYWICAMSVLALLLIVFSFAGDEDSDGD